MQAQKQMRINKCIRAYTNKDLNYAEIEQINENHMNSVNKF